MPLGLLRPPSGLGKAEVGGIAAQGCNEFEERLPSADAFWSAGTEEDDIQRENLLRRRRIAPIEQVE
jgi:hypothetical protein